MNANDFRTQYLNRRARELETEVRRLAHERGISFAESLSLFTVAQVESLEMTLSELGSSIDLRDAA